MSSNGVKIYQVIVIDLWNNMYNVGYFKNLDDAIPELNTYISDDLGIKLEPGDIKEYPSTFNMVFDCSAGDILVNKTDDPELIEKIESDEDLYSLQIRGFIYDKDRLIEEIEKE